MLRRLIGEDVELEIDLDPKAGTIYIDRSLLEQVLLNMALNARDAMPDGGKLLVRTRPLDLGDNLFRKLAELTAGHYALIEVTDTGTGMDESTSSRIFEPFFTTKEFGKGTGLGLATAYGIIKQAGGTIDVASTPGEGTSFLIYLPLQKGQAPHATIEDPQNKAHGEETILVVEDKPGVLKLARRMLERNGFTTIEAASPLEAIALVNRYPSTIDLLLTDVVMPDMSGPELVKQLKPLRPEMQVVYMSADTNEHFSGEIDPNALLRKPFSEGAITVKVRQALDMAHS
ncbi:MAG TPA: response regulator [Candidatus Latescibacteria bacterium]|nr:response regulator [Candidatus Latescibacterota bacterium]